MLVEIGERARVSVSVCEGGDGTGVGSTTPPDWLLGPLKLFPCLLLIWWSSRGCVHARWGRTRRGAESNGQCELAKHAPSVMCTTRGECTGRCAEDANALCSRTEVLG
jgi:hypothetical protein